jgi:hypothetical protein
MGTTEEPPVSAGEPLAADGKADTSAVSTDDDAFSNAAKTVQSHYRSQKARDAIAYQHAYAAFIQTFWRMSRQPQEEVVTSTGGFCGWCTAALHSEKQAPKQTIASPEQFPRSAKRVNVRAKPKHTALLSLPFSTMSMLPSQIAEDIAEEDQIRRAATPS